MYIRDIELGRILLLAVLFAVSLARAGPLSPLLTLADRWTNVLLYVVQSLAALTLSL